MAATQADLREMAAQLSRDAKALHEALCGAWCRDEITLAMHREANAYVFCIRTAADSAKYALGEFQGLTTEDMTQADEANHR